MPGQPKSAGVLEFDVNTLEVVEPGTTVPDNILDVGEAFHLRATFKASGSTWTTFGPTAKYHALFHAERMGGPAGGNIPFGTESGDVSTLVPVGDEYPIVKAVSGGITAAGVYRCGVVITFTIGAGTPWLGLLGFNEDCIIQVNPQEQ